MKIASLVVLGLLLLLIGLAPIARASPFQAHDLTAFIVEAGEKEFGEEAKGGGGKGHIKHSLSTNPANSGNMAAGGAGGTLNVKSSDPVQSVPIPGTLLLFGGGFVALTLWHQRSRRGVSAVDPAA